MRTDAYYRALAGDTGSTAKPTTPSRRFIVDEHSADNSETVNVPYPTKPPRILQRHRQRRLVASGLMMQKRTGSAVPVKKAGAALRQWSGGDAVRAASPPRRAYGNRKWFRTAAALRVDAGQIRPPPIRWRSPTDHQYVALAVNEENAAGGREYRPD